MSKPPSPETLLKRARTQVRQLADEVSAQRRVNDQLATRAAKAEKERDEWKARFDLLLSKCAPMNAESDAAGGSS